MKIWVEHEVSNHPNSCLYYSDGSFMDGREVCKYHKFLTQTHGRKRPPDRHKPKCILFDTWLEEPYKKCPECERSIEENGWQGTKTEHYFFTHLDQLRKKK